jgi:signal transduction histidine kinase
LYARPAEDAPGWTETDLGPDGLERPLPHREGIAWIVLRFQLAEIPASTSDRLALLLSNPADADELYLNGVLIGGEGRIAPKFSEVPSGPRKAEFDEKTLRLGWNELSMKVLISGRNVGIFDGPVFIGTQGRIEAERERLQRPIVITEAAFLSMFVLLLTFYGFLIAKGVIRSDYVLFTGFTAVYGLLFLLDSNLLYASGYAASWMSTLGIVLSPILVILMLMLISKLTGGPTTLLFKGLVAVGVAFAVADVALPPLTVLEHLSGPRKVFMAVLGVYYLYLAGKAVLARHEESIPVLLGVSAYVIGSRVDLFIGTELRDFGVGFFALCMLYALTSRHARLKNRLMEVSSKLLDAHEEERRRLARDIHDGIGQSLLGLKLKLQMAVAKVKKGETLPAETLDAIVKDSSAIIEEVRRTAMDLRPSYVEGASLLDSMKWYAESFRQDRAFELHFHTGDEEVGEPPPRIKDNFYRIFQEILANAAKHSGATRIDIALYRSGKTLILLATDNGHGFDLAESRNPGMGLVTMRERAELLGGFCFVESRPGYGTTVRVEVPLP